MQISNLAGKSSKRERKEGFRNPETQKQKGEMT